jgi:hypothetical protein
MQEDFLSVAGDWPGIVFILFWRRGVSVLIVEGHQRQTCHFVCRSPNWQQATHCYDCRQFWYAVFCLFSSLDWKDAPRRFYVETTSRHQEGRHQALDAVRVEVQGLNTGGASKSHVAEYWESDQDNKIPESSSIHLVIPSDFASNLADKPTLNCMQLICPSSSATNANHPLLQTIFMCKSLTH